VTDSDIRSEDSSDEDLLFDEIRMCSAL
jgi:hypothetical protein